jgi:hypothetical protein
MNAVRQLRESIDRSNARHNGWRLPDATDDGDTSGRSRDDRARYR